MTAGPSTAGRPRIAIVGGGISGVTAAYALAKRHPDVAFTLFEASRRLGGTIETVQDDGFTVECGPDSWVTEKPWARELAEELGLGDEVIPSHDYRRITYVTSGRELVPMPDGLRMMVPTRWEPLLHSPLLSWQARLAYLREPGRADALKRDALAGRGADADESVTDFVLRHFGEEVARTLAAPLLSGVFGGDIAKLSVRAVMAPFVAMEAEHGSLIEALRLRARLDGRRAATFSSLRSGLETLVRATWKQVPAAAIQLDTPVTAVALKADGWHVVTARGQDIYDAVVLATPAHVTRMLLGAIGRPEATQAALLLPTEASSSIVVAIGFVNAKARGMRVPRGFGFLVPQDAKAARSLLACTFVDQKFSHRAAQGDVLLRGFFGGEVADELAGASDAELVRLTRQQLSRWLGPLPEPDLAIVRQWPRSLPQYHVGHVQRIQHAERLVGRLPGLRLVGNAYHGVGLPDLIRDARAVADSFGESATTGTRLSYRFAG